MSVCRSNPIHTAHVVGLNTEHVQTGLRSSSGPNADSHAQSDVRQRQVSSTSLIASCKPHQVRGLNSSCRSGLETLRRTVMAGLNVLARDGCGGLRSQRTRFATAERTRQMKR